MKEKKKNAATPQPDETERQWRVHRRLVRVGQGLMVLGALVVVFHWLLHLEAFGPGQPPGWVDLAAGYPIGAVLIILGAILAGRKRPAPRQTRST